MLAIGKDHGPILDNNHFMRRCRNRALKRRRSKIFYVHNWYPGDKNARVGFFNFVTNWPL
jgi:hypothetical protein